MTRFTKWQKLMMLAMPLAITTNPLTIEIFLEWYKWMFTGISVLATLYIVCFTLYMCFSPTPTHIPSKKAVNKKQPVFLDS